MPPSEADQIGTYIDAIRSLHRPTRAPATRSDPAALRNALERIEEDGYVIVEGAVSSDDMASIREEVAALLGDYGRNPFEGYRTRRVYGVLAHTLACNTLLEHPLVLDLLDRLLLPNYLLSQLVAIDIQPGEDAQVLHYDDGIYPVPRPRKALSAATIWAVNDVTADNGGTRVIPGSHRWGDRNPTLEDLDGAVSVEMPAGSMVFFLGTLWHGGGANIADRGRLCLTAQYCEPWCRTVENYSRSMPLERVNRCSPALQSMLGFSIHPPLMGYVDGRHPSKLL